MGLIDIGSLTIEDRMLRAKIQMHKRTPFFGFILSQMKVIEDKEGKYLPPNNRTMGVDSNGNLYWAKEFVDKLSEEELMGVIAHEVMHIALMHLERLAGREPYVFNIANDLIVNDVLMMENFKLPAGGCIPDRYHHSFKINGKEIKNINEKSSEELYDEIYPLIPKQPKGGAGKGEGTGNSEGVGNGKPGNNPGEGDGGNSKLDGFDNHIYGKKDPKGGKGEGQKDWRKIISEAANIAKQQGKLPAGLEGRIEDILETKVDWKQLLRKYITAQIPFDYTWSKPSKKSQALGIYLPREVRESLQVIFHIDTSGSMGSDELGQALGELQGIMDSYGSVKIDVLVGDAEMQNTFTLTKDNAEDIIGFAKELKGGGGTDHRYVFDYVEDELQDAKVLILFTDGYTSFPDKCEEDFNFKTFWVLTKHSCPESNIPFGAIVKLGE